MRCLSAGLFINFVPPAKNRAGRMLKPFRKQTESEKEKNQRRTKEPDPLIKPSESGAAAP
jgi:hypothetical protein